MKKILLSSVVLFSGVFVPAAYAQQDATAPAIAQQAAAPAAVPMTANETTVPAPGGDVVAALPDPATAQIEQSPIEKEINDQLTFVKPTIDVNAMHSLFFSIWEHDLLMDARRGLNTRMPGTDDGTPKETVREVALSGIVYHSSKEWTIWLNDLRVSPTAIPDEVMDLKVHKDYIELQWFDSTTNQIFPIRLRAHERFNLDTRIFLPG